MKTLLLLAASALLALPMVATLTSCANNPAANAFANATLDQAQVELELRQSEYAAAVAMMPSNTPAEVAARDAKLARLSANVKRAEALVNSIRAGINAPSGKNPTTVSPTSAYADGQRYRSEREFTIPIHRVAFVPAYPIYSAFTRPQNVTKVPPPTIRELTRSELEQAYPSKARRYLS